MACNTSVDYIEVHGAQEEKSHGVTEVEAFTNTHMIRGEKMTFNILNQVALTVVTTEVVRSIIISEVVMEKHLTAVEVIPTIKDLTGINSISHNSSINNRRKMISKLYRIQVSDRITAVVTEAIEVLMVPIINIDQVVEEAIEVLMGMQHFIKAL